MLIPNCASPEATRWRSVELAKARDRLGRAAVPKKNEPQPLQQLGFDVG
jgi:hypothetical protein